MGGLTKFINRYKKIHPGTDYTDEELKKLWMETATRGELYYQKTKEENPEWSHGAICNDYMFGGGLIDPNGKCYVRAKYNHDGYVPENLYREYGWRNLYTKYKWKDDIVADFIGKFICQYNLIGEFLEKDFNCGCLPGQKCPDFYMIAYRYERISVNRNKERNDTLRISKFCYEDWYEDIQRRSGYINKAHNLHYIDVKKVRYYDSKPFCNYYKKQLDPAIDDTYDTKPAREIPLSGSV